MRTILAIFKKEIKRFLTDKRLLLSLLLPGLLIYIVYSFMGSFFGDMFSTENTDYVVLVYNQPASLEAVNNSEGLSITIKDGSGLNIEDAITQLKNEEIHLILNYDKDFDAKLLEGQKPAIEMHYSSSSINSSTIMSYYSNVLNSCAIKDVSYMVLPAIDYAEAEDVSGMIMTMLMPFLLVILLATGCLAVSTESIAGEKERGTVATLLVTPVKREHIAIGKILALSVVSILSATSSFLGVLLSLPKLLGGSMGGADINITYLGGEEYFSIFVVLIVLVLLFNMMLSIVSCYAKSVKEASQLATPVLLLIIFISIPSMISMGKVVENPFLYLIPIYNALQTLMACFASNINVLNFVLTIVSNLFVTIIGVLALAKMFGSEKVMFNK